MTLNTLEEAQEIRRCIKILQDTANYLNEKSIEDIGFTSDSFSGKTYWLHLEHLKDDVISKRISNKFLDVIVGEIKLLNEKFTEL